ncbi:MAG: SET domain-containing protein [Lysobacter sp.]|nr:MAG: SET domain-containing protein [Lysobacter sp.]
MPSKIVARRSPIHGTGVFATQPIEKGERIIEYKGRRRTHDDVDSGDEGSAESGHTFLFTLNDEYVIDGNIDGGVARWINHSCSPNCEAVLIEHEGDDRRRDRVFIEAKRAMKAGAELTYDYGITLGEPHTPRLKKIWACLCGARNCTGTMLKPKRATTKAGGKVVKKAGSRKTIRKTGARKAATKAVTKAGKDVTRKATGKKTKATGKKTSRTGTTARR